MGRFEGKRALVTGSGSGIGRACALKLAEEGAEVFALSKTKSNLDTLKLENPKITTICINLTDWNEVRKTVQDILPIHLVVNNAGCAQLADALDATEKDFDETFAVNVKPIINVTQVVAKDLINRKLHGSVVNISSQAGQRAFRDHLVYCSSKSAVDMLTKVFALELGPSGIRVNAVSPTVVMTAMGKIGWSDPAKAGPMLDRIPQRRFAEVVDVVHAVIYLLSDESDMVNGHMLPVDGGFLAA